MAAAARKTTATSNDSDRHIDAIQGRICSALLALASARSDRIERSLQLGGKAQRAGVESKA